MPTDLQAAVAALSEALRAFDPVALSADECVSLVSRLATVEKACAAARAAARARAAAVNAHRASGVRDPADWLARETGSSPGEAKAALATAGALDDCPRTGEALAAGELSLAQASEITKTEGASPGSEAELVELAKRSSLAALREEARKRRLNATDPEDLHARQRKARHVRHWRDELGMVTGRFCLPPEVGLPFLHRLEAETDRVRRTNREESREALAADAFAVIVSGSGKGKAGIANLVIVCDLRAYRRGHTHPGEPCHLLDGTPMPANHGPTSYDNLRPRCWSHHQDKTERDRAAGLLGGGGREPP